MASSRNSNFLKRTWRLNGQTSSRTYKFLDKFKNFAVLEPTIYSSWTCSRACSRTVLELLRIVLELQEQLFLNSRAIQELQTNGSKTVLELLRIVFELQEQLVLELKDNSRSTL